MEPLVVLPVVRFLSLSLKQSARERRSAGPAVLCQGSGEKGAFARGRVQTPGLCSLLCLGGLGSSYSR